MYYISLSVQFEVLTKFQMLRLLGWRGQSCCMLVTESRGSRRGQEVRAVSDELRLQHIAE